MPEPIATTTPAGRVAMWLQLHPGQALTVLDAASLLGVHRSKLDDLLLPAVQAGLVLVANDADAGRVYRPGRQLASWQQPVATSATSTAAKTAGVSGRPAGGRGGAHKHLPALDLASLRVATGVPLPPDPRKLVGKTKYDHVFDALTADGMCVTTISASYIAAMRKAAITYLQHRPKLKKTSRLVVRSMPDKALCGVWRLSLADAAAAGLK